jgi:hypothetical protein
MLKIKENCGTLAQKTNVGPEKTYYAKVQHGNNT